MLAAAAEDDGAVTTDTDLEDAATDRRRFSVAWETNLTAGAGLASAVLGFGEGAVMPMLGLVRRVTGGGLEAGLKDLARATFTPPWSVAAGVEVAAALVVVRRGAALAVLAADDSESQLDTDVLARDDFSRGTPVGGLVTINRFT